jgi:membrane-bound lytic murein transglycosylase B
MHGEIGQTQFLPKNILNYGGGGNLDNSAAALNATAAFLRAHGWQAGGGYQPGEANFGAIQAWNAAQVYQRAIAIIGRQIDGGGSGGGGHGGGAPSGGGGGFGGGGGIFDDQ